MSERKSGEIPSYARFLLGGTSGMMATSIVQPLDLVKNRMQMSGKGGAVREHKTSFHALINISRKEGIRAIYTGLSAGLLRQATYTTARLGVFTSLMETLKGVDGSQPSFGLKLIIAATAGCCGAFVGTPAELALIRMTSDGCLPPEHRRNYKNVFHALIRVMREEGVLALWTGLAPTVSRSMMANVSQLVTYSQSKQMLLSSGLLNDNIGCHFAASMLSGFMTAFTTMPFDIAKTRIQNMTVVNGKPEYTGVLDVWRKVVVNEGYAALLKGFTPTYLRIGPHTVFTFVFLEQLTKLAKAFYAE